MCSGELAFAERYGLDRAWDLIADAYLATAWVVSQRLRDALGDLDIAGALALTPALPPGFARTVTTDGNRVRCVLAPESPALLDKEQGGWIGSLARGDTRGPQGIVQALDGRARVDAVTNDGTGITIDVTVDEQAAAAPEPEVIAFMKIGMLSEWKFNLAP
jgi:hypothetical protein